jgi:putative transcriptional regulator
MSPGPESFMQPAPTPGCLLVAHPRMLDPNFMHSVILVCDHGAEGTYGLVLNRRTDRRVSELGSDLPLLAGRADPLWLGGPVSTGTLQILHRLGREVEGAHGVVPGAFIGGDPEELYAAIADVARIEPDVNVTLRDLRFVLGYSGWGEGQLDTELAEGAWVVCPATPALLFDDEPHTLWRRVLRARGRPFSALADLPPDPSWN